MSPEAVQFLQDNAWVISLISAAVSLAAPLISRIEYDWKRKSIQRDIEIFVAWKDYGSAEILGLVRKQINRSLQAKYGGALWLNTFWKIYNPAAISLNLLGAAYYLCHEMQVIAAIHIVCASAIMVLVVIDRRVHKKAELIQKEANERYNALIDDLASDLEEMILLVEGGVSIDDIISKIGVRRTIANRYAELVSNGDPVVKRSFDEAMEKALGRIAMKHDSEKQNRSQSLAENASEETDNSSSSDFISV